MGASETVAMSLLTLTTLLSSFLIYNSKKVPQKVDLDKMRCFSQLSASLLSQCGECMSSEAKRVFFPQFLWLLRDVSLKMTDREGKELEPTEYLHTRVLASESGELTELGRSLVSLFPSLECATLPIPSTKRDIIRDIVRQQDKLKPAFNAAVDALIQHILQKVAPKKGVDGTTAVTGKALAALAEGYVEAVNRPGALPDLNQGWQAVVRLELKEVSYRLVREYERETEEGLEGNLPMEERNLLRVHQQTLKKSKECLRQYICRVNPLHSSDGESAPLLDELEEEIVQWSGESGEDEGRRVTGGVLYQFTTRNFTKSKQHCETLLTELVKNSKVQEKVNYAVSNSEPLDIARQVSAITAEYHSRAVGPAAREVLEKGISELNQLSDILKKIPGQPVVVRTKSGRISVKLYWDPPKRNPEAVEEYVVYKKIKGGEWEEGGRTEKTKLLVKGLKSNSNYEFQVIATNKTLMSLTSRVFLSTEISTAAAVGDGVLMGAGASLYLPITIGIAHGAFRKGDDNLLDGDDDDWSKTKAYSLLGLCIAAIPVSIVLAPVTLPVLTVASAKMVKNKVTEPEEESDDDY